MQLAMTGPVTEALILYVFSSSRSGTIEREVQDAPVDDRG
jgi:hypothetical protein